MKQYRNSGSTCTSSSSRSVDVGINILWYRKLNNDIDTSNIEPSRSYVGGHQDRESPVPKVSKGYLTLALRNIAVQHSRSPLDHSASHKLVGFLLRLREHKAPALSHCTSVRCDDIIKESSSRIAFRYSDRAMPDRCGSLVLFTPNSIVQVGLLLVLLGNSLDPGRHGGGEKDCLTLLAGRQVVENSLNIIRKTHRKHFIRFVKDTEPDPRQI
mmetsp:Transcript_40654/g.161221  ORF Transcript_40654/g.161221 Transcript_40654/m.161221 type:complete len:213 (+) Transcript_40654:2423-3061(+)